MLGSSLFILAASGDQASDDVVALRDEIRAADISEARLAQARALLRDRYESLALRTRPYFSIAVDVALFSRWGIPEHPGGYAALVDATTVAGLQAAAERWLDPGAAWDIRFLASEVVAELPTDKEGLYQMGLAAAESGDLVRAIAAFEGLLALGANDMNTVIYRYTLGDLNFSRRDYAEARRHLEAGLAVIDYPALRELLEEVNAADSGWSPAVSAPSVVAEGATPAPSSARVVDTAGDEPAWAAEAGEVMGQLESWRGLTFQEDLVVHFESSAGEGVAGYYEPATKRLVVGLSNSARFNRGTMLHEMYHALQDQHFDLSALHRVSDTLDYQRTLSALIEGEAMLAVAELMDYDFLAHATIPEDGALNVDRYESIFRYGDGQRFILHLQEVGGWELVSAAFAEPPRTTAEIYHPERYLSGWSPVPVRKLPSLKAARGETLVMSEPVGEYGLRLFLAGAPATRSLAPALGSALLGDQHLIARSAAGERRMAWVLVFSDAHSARRFLEAAPDAAAAVPAMSGLVVEDLGYVRRARGYGVRMGWSVVE
jgi:tetratricopeptide (TPR) repeat protein